MRERVLVTAAAFLSATALATTSFADPPVVRGQFTDRVEHGRPVGDANAAAQGRQIWYWIELDNHDLREITLTLVWRADGHEVFRQHIVTRGRATWAFYPRRHIHTIAVSVLDATGHQVHTDEATLPESGGT
jgi:hypothetical protein